MKQNRLSLEKSPYLLQHAGNPVDWYPWGPEAFEKAREEDRPVFLSIGYSTCHWCHVMAHESFEDEEVAGLLNSTFVCIKVDREERPDIDGIYMAACQMMTGSGGWPLTILLNPDQRPFFAATYIPKEGMFGASGLLELLPRIGELWKHQRSDIEVLSDGINNALLRKSEKKTRPEMDAAFVEAAVGDLVESYDDVHGGFGAAPKFPMPHNLLMLLRQWKKNGQKQALAMAEGTLSSMRLGGLYDHLGYGYHRYSTDEKWLVPHFEKMLYDQALHSLAALEAYQAVGKLPYLETAQNIFEYVLRDLRSPEGGYHSAEDADSEGAEGKFYIWTAGELRALLGDANYELFAQVYNVSKAGNFHDDASGRQTAENILHLKRPVEEEARRLLLAPGELEERLRNLRRILKDVRDRRVRPHRDDKVLTDWNGLMIAALATGARVTGNRKYADEARKTVDFILHSMNDGKGRLLHRYRDGEAAVPANLEDYSFLIWGLLELYETTLDPVLFKEAVRLNEALTGHFWDGRGGGFFFTPDDGEKLLFRQKESYDGAIPSGNSVAAHNLLRLARMTGDAELEKKALTLIKAFVADASYNPSAHIHLISALDFAIGPCAEIVIAGKRGSDDTNALVEAVHRTYLPHKVLVLRDTGDIGDPVATLAPFTKEMTTVKGWAAAYVCTGQTCKSPVTDPEELRGMLESFYPKKYALARTR